MLTIRNTKKTFCLLLNQESAPNKSLLERIEIPTLSTKNSTNKSLLKQTSCNDWPYFIQVLTMMQPHGPLLCFISLHISNGSVSTSLVRHVLYSANLMSATCIPCSLFMVHRYIYSRYSSVFPMLYQLYHSLPFSTLNSSSSLYLSVATWVTP